MGNNNVNTRRQLNLLLSEGLVVQKILGNKQEITDALLSKSGKVRILYGETYDQYGVTIDSLKYYLFLEYLARIVGTVIECVVVEGDLHSVINPSVKEKDALILEGRGRVNRINKIFQVLEICQAKVRLMSEIFGDKKIKKLVSKTVESVKKRNDLQEQLSATVLANRIAQEKKSGFRYASEAIGLALNFDLKVGPPRENNYDQTAQSIAKEFDIRGYKAIYLRPSYPFADDFSYYLTHPEIEHFGLTPYKAGSNKLQRQRIVVGQTSVREIERFMTRAYVPADILDANPLVDVATIVVMSEQIRNNRIDVFEMDTEIRKLVDNRSVLAGKLVKLLEGMV